MKLLVLLLLSVTVTTLGFAYSEGALRTFFQYACFGTLIVSGALLVTGAAD